MGTKTAKLILFSSLFIIVLLISLSVTGCSSKASQTSETTTSNSGSSTSVSGPKSSMNEWDIESYLFQHLLKLSTTYHGKRVFSYFVDSWTHGNYEHNQDGTWLARMLVEDTLVKGNEFLEPIFADSTSKDGIKYRVEWKVSADGKEITPSNDIATKLEAELGK